jgi:hypothetical protein
MRAGLLTKRQRENTWVWAGLASILLVFVALGTWLDTLPLLLVGTLVLLVGLLVVAVFLKRPGTLLLIYLLALPSYTLTLAVLFKYSGSVPLVKTIQPWKEALAVGMLLLIGFGILARLHTSRLCILDMLVLLYMGLNVLYLFVPWGPGLSARLYGLRANSFFVVIYWLGRLVPLTQRQQRWALGILICVGALAGVATIVEFVALPSTWPVQAGLMDYLRAFWGIQPIGHYGLTWTFETSTGLRRYSAFFANPLELASSTLLTGVAALSVAFHYRPRTRGKLLGTASFGLIALSLLLSISRASLVSFFIQMRAISFLLKKRRFRLLLAIAAIVGVSALFISGSKGLVDFVWNTITFQNPSSQGHAQAWLQGVKAILENPFGLGLGTSGQVGNRFGRQVGGENQYVIIGVELGLLGLALYIAILAFSIKLSLKASVRSTGVTKILAFVAGASKFAFLFSAFTAHMEIYVFAMFVSWWLVGFSVQQLMQVKVRPESQVLKGKRVEACSFQSS